MPMSTVISDLTHGARMLFRHPGVYTAAFLTLAVGIASATTMFSIVNAVLLAPLPYANADRLALVWDRTGDSGRDVWLSPPEFADLRDMSEAFAEAAALTDRRYTLTGRAEPEELQAAAVSPNLFAMVGARAIAGRALQAGDDAHGSGFAAVISEPVAERLFSSAAAAIGQALTLDGQAWTVVGVLPRSFSIWPPSTVFPRRVDVWVPIDDQLYTAAGRNQNFLHALVRVKDGVSFERASADLARVAGNIERAHLDFYANQRWRMTLVGLREHLVGAVRPAVLILFGAVGLLLLIACANVGNLLLARAGARAQEMAVRAALGASRGRLLRQVLAENAVLAGVAACAGVVLAAWAVAWIAHAGPDDVPRLETATIDVSVLAFSACLAIGTTLLFGAAPALQLSRAQTGERLKEGLRGSTSGPRGRRLRGAFVVTQVALAVVLAISTGLLLKGFIVLGRTDTGFEADALATGRVRLPVSRYAQPADRAAFFAQLTERLTARADIAAAAAVTQLPMTGAFLGSTFAVPAGDSRATTAEFGADLRGVTPSYFSTLGIRLSGGRAFTARDTRESTGVAVVDETLARRFWPDGQAVGRHLRWVRTNELLEVVGIVAAVRHYGLAAPPRETVYRPYAQYAVVPEMFIEARSPRGYDAARQAIVEEVRRLDLNQPVADLGRVDALVEESLGQPRFNTLLLTIFATIALLLAAVGIYGVMAFAVSERTREIGVRMALGADPASVLRLVVGDGAWMTAGGVVAGVALAIVVARALRTMLFGVNPWDPAVFAGVTLLLSAVALFASYLPARRAARLDPTVALRRG
jgi:putative ABC transport system permease protein